MRNRAYVLVMLAFACNSPAKQASPGTGEGSAIPRPIDASSQLDAPQRPESVPGPSHELREELGLDGPDVPAIRADVTARFAVLTVDADSAPKTAMAFPPIVRVYRVTAGKVELEATAKFEVDTHVTSWAWRDQNELVLLVGKLRDNELEPSLHRLVSGKLEPLPWPDKKYFKATKPPHTIRYDHLIATASNEVWLNLCRARQERDPHDCTDHVSVRVAPSAIAAAVPPRERTPPAGLDAPPGWSSSVKPLAGRKTGTLECKGPGGIETTLAPTEPRSFGFRKGSQWLSHHPPIQLVAEEVGGMDDDVNALWRINHHYLKECKLTPGDAELAEPGPSGFWSVHDGHAVNAKHGALIVLWHGRIVATFADAERIAFAM